MTELKRKMIIDCDTGTDDAVAVTGLLLADNIDVIAITSVHGNIPVECAAKNNLELVNLLKKDIPVYMGCPHGLTSGLFPGRTLNTLTQTTKKEYEGEQVRIHELDLGLPVGDRNIEKEHAVSYIVRTLRDAEEPIDICATGPLTNIAAAFIMAPDIAEKIGTIYIMGGGIYIGNRTPVGEANFVDDPEAAAKVMLSGANILLNPIEANESCATYSVKDIEDIADIGGEVAEFISMTMKKFIWRCSVLWEPGFDLPPFEINPDANGCIHDWAAVAPAIDPTTVLVAKDEVCRVDCSGGMADGQLIVDRRGYVKEPNVKLVYEMDEKKSKKLLLDLIAKSNN